jgi:hypothetical protein
MLLNVSSIQGRLVWRISSDRPKKTETRRWIQYGHEGCGVPGMSLRSIGPIGEQSGCGGPAVTRASTGFAIYAGLGGGRR